MPLFIFNFTYNILYLGNQMCLFLHAFVLCVPEYEQLIAKSCSSVHVHDLRFCIYCVYFQCIRIISVIISEFSNEYFENTSFEITAINFAVHLSEPSQTAIISFLCITSLNISTFNTLTGQILILTLSVPVSPLRMAHSQISKQGYLSKGNTMAVIKKRKYLHNTT